MGTRFLFGKEMLWDFSREVRAAGCLDEEILVKFLARGELGGGIGVAFAEKFARNFDEHGKDGNADDGEDDELEVVFEEGDIAEEPASGEDEADPEDGTDYVEAHEFLIIHFAGASDEGGEGADDGDEAREDDRFAAVFIEKAGGFIDVLLFDELGEALEHPLAGGAPDEIIDGVAEDGGEEQDGGGEPDIEARILVGGDGTDGEEEGIAGEEGEDDEACFAENDGEKEDVDESAVLAGEGFEVLVEVEEEIENFFNLHRFGES